MEFQVSRDALVPKYLIWPEADWSELSEREELASLFMADAAAILGSKRLPDGPTLAVMVVVRPPMSHESDEVLIAIAKDQIHREIAQYG